MQQAVEQTMMPSQADTATQSIGAALNSVGTAIKNIGKNIGNDIVEARRKRKAIAELRSLNNRMLADIGLNRSEIMAVVYNETHSPRQSG